MGILLKFGPAFLLIFIIILDRFDAENIILPSDKECTIRLPESDLVTPLIDVGIGMMSDVIQQKSQPIVLYQHDELTAVCPTGFNNMLYSDDFNFSIPIEKRDIKIICTDGMLVIDDGNFNGDILLQCNEFKLGLFTDMSVTECGLPGSQMYSLFTNTLDKNVLYARVCLNTKEMSFESVQYRAVKPALLDNNEKWPSLREHYEPEIFNFDRKYNNLRLLFSKKLPFFDETDWSHFINYQWESILQTPEAKELFANHDYLMKINWLKNLLHGNWRSYSLALSTQLEHKMYDISAGVDGKVKLPFNETEFLVYHNTTVPLYVWNYVKGYQNKEEFIIIGYNSPFYEFHTNETTFCKNICDQIEWLKEPSSKFQYAIFGIVFCCTIDEARNSNKLPSLLPKKPEPSKVSENTDSEAAVAT